MNNVWNSRFDNIVCDASWGVFGNNNINTVNVSNSRINRFDTHCYGRDFKFRNCELSEYGLTQSSFFGALEFEKCTFKTAIVCFCRTDYNAFTPFTIKLSNCTIYLDKSHSYLIRLGNVIEGANSRQELQTKYTPGVTLINSTIVLTEDLPYWSIFLLKNQSSEKPFDYLGKILIDGVQVEENETDLAVFDRPIRCDNPVCIDINRLNLFVRNIDSIKRPLVSRRPTILFNINQDGTDVFHISNSQLNYNSIDIPTSRLVSNNSN